MHISKAQIHLQMKFFVLGNTYVNFQKCCLNLTFSTFFTARKTLYGLL